jgi:lysophospholipase L1-like esterase
MPMGWFTRFGEAFCRLGKSPRVITLEAVNFGSARSHRAFLSTPTRAMHVSFSIHRRRAILMRVFAVCLLFTAARAEIVLQEKVERLAVPHQGPFVRAGDGAIWGVDERGALVSRDEGTTWEAREIFDGTRFRATKERALFRTKEGVIVYAFLNDRERVFKWDDQKGGPQEGCRLPVYVCRSDNDGKTWDAPRFLQDGWCGAVRQIIQLRSGRLVLVSQKAMANPGRHVTITYVSDDLAKTWQTGETIDLGTRGNYAGQVAGLPSTTHGGGIEGTVLERGNGDLKLLLRVPHGYFEELTSKDGLRWSAAMPSTIEASDSPGMMTRLASGRVVLIWNRFVDPVKRVGRREEVSLAFSNNDGVTWTMPQVIAVNRASAGARESSFWISYPYVFEASPGRLWISTMQGGLRAVLNEKDFLVPVEKPLDGIAVRLLTLGDSITRGARPSVNPTQTFGSLLQASLRESGIKAQVHNVGIGSERTDLALQRLEADVISQRPHVVTVMYGTNDSWVDKGKTLSRLTEQQFEDNLREIVRRLRAARIGVVLMTAPKFGEKNPRNGLDEDPNLRLARYMDVTRKVARDLGVPLVDHFDHWQTEQSRGRILQAWTTDGCHPNAAGHAELTRLIVPAVLPLARTATN